MIGSASAWRSYGFTHGSMLPQPASTSAASASEISLVLLTVTSLLQQRANLIQILALIAGLVALVQGSHVALTVDEHGARHRLHVVHRADLALAIEEDGEGHRRLAQPLLGVLAVGVDVDADQREACLLYTSPSPRD